MKKIYFQVTFSLPLPSSLLNLPILRFRIAFTANVNREIRVYMLFQKNRYIDENTCLESGSSLRYKKRKSGELTTGATIRPVFCGMRCSACPTQSYPNMA